MRKFIKKISGNRGSDIAAEVDALMKKHKKIKLNIGCGTDYKKGWVNIDNNSDDNIEKLDLNWDLRDPLPFADNSVDYIFHEHFMEHLTVEESQKANQDFMRVLKPGGVMRIAMPDLRDCVDIYLDKKWKSRKIIRDHGLDFVQTPAELMNMSFRWWGHMWIYDWAELRRRLKEAGYTNVKKCKSGQSDHPALRKLETRKMSTLVAEVTK